MRQAAPQSTLRPMSVTFPDGFLWGVAAAAHQIEGGNWNNDWWAFEHAARHAVASSRRATARDSYHRYADDIALVARPRLRRVPVLDRVVADRARGRRVLGRRARLLPAHARASVTSRACSRS